MARYIRAFAPGGTWFFTVALAERGSRLLVERIDELREATDWTLRRYPFTVDAWVVLPDHLHAVWSLPEGDTDFPLRWRMIKSRLSRSLPADIGVGRRTGERGIWQRRYWEHLIRDEDDYAAHVEYCWFNPVKHGFTARAVDWPYSSFHRDVRAGRIEADWGGDFRERANVGWIGEAQSTFPGR